MERGYDLVFLKKLDFFSAILAILMVASLCISTTLTHAASQKETLTKQSVTLPKSLPKPASLIRPNQKAIVGDFVLIQRPFYDWLLRCEVLLSAERRLCNTQQVLSSGDATLIWRIILAEDGKPYVLIATSPKLNIKKGLLIVFSGIEKTLKADDDIACSSTSCIGAFAFTGVLQSAIMSSPTVSFEYHDITGEKMEFNGSINGLDLALKAASDNIYSQKSPQFKKSHQSR